MTAEAAAGKVDGAGSFAGERVSFTGRLASLPRREAARLVVEQQGAYSPRVTRSTTILVIGQDGWPLRQNGRLTRKLTRAKSLARRRYAIDIVSESEFLARLGVQAADDPVSRRYDPVQLSQVLGISGRGLRAWMHAGLLQPVEHRGGVPLFDFLQMARARALLKLTRAGVPLKTLERSLAQLRRVLPEAGDLLDRLTPIEWSGRLALCTDRGDYLEPTGQLLFNFGNTDSFATVALEPRHDAGLFAFAVQCEEEGDYQAAAEAYRRLLMEEGPDAEVCFNLGNALYGLGDCEGAIAQFREATRLDPDDPEAWNNLANLLAEAGRLTEAVEAFGRALAIDPHYADVHYGLADVLEELGRRREARMHWRLYLKQDPESDWAEYARSRLIGG